jgi:hypothetical protein
MNIDRNMSEPHRRITVEDYYDNRDYYQQQCDVWLWLKGHQFAQVLQVEPQPSFFGIREHFTMRVFFDGKVQDWHIHHTAPLLVFFLTEDMRND